MFWWLLALLVLLPVVLREVTRRKALTGAVPKALPGPPAGLQARLASVDAAIEGVRSALGLMSTPTSMAAAALALRRFGAGVSARDPDRPARTLPSVRNATHPLVPFDEPGEAGPATQRFEALLWELSRIDEADLRDLADAGLNPTRIVDALAAAVDPDRWERDLLSALDYWQQTVANLRTGDAYR